MLKRPLAVLLLGAALAVGGCTIQVPGSGGGGGGDAEAGASDAEAAPSGIADQAPEQILTASAEAFRNASSVRLSGSMVRDGGTTTVEGQITREGDAQVSTTSGGVTVDVITLGGQTWFRSPGMWGQVNPNIAELVGDQWVLIDAYVEETGLTAGMTELGNMDTYAAILQSSGGPLEKVEGQPVDGVPTVGIRDGQSGTLYVAAEGEPYPMLITPPEGEDQSQSFQMSGYNEPPAITAPQNTIDDFQGFMQQAAR